MDAKSHDGQSAAGPVTEGHVHSSQDNQQEMLAQHGAAAAGNDDDVAADEDGEMRTWLYFSVHCISSIYRNSEDKNYCSCWL